MSFSLTARDEPTTRLVEALQHAKRCLAQGNATEADEAIRVAEQALRDLLRSVAELEQRLLGLVLDSARDAGRLAASAPATTSKRNGAHDASRRAGKSDVAAAAAAQTTAP